MSGIDIQTYANLSTYEILAPTSIALAADPGTIVVGGNFSAATVTGFRGLGSTGVNEPTKRVAALTELRTFADAVNTAAALLPTGVLANADTTFVPGFNYTTAGSAFITGRTLTFDAQNVPSAKFFVIVPGTLTMTNVAITLVNGASAANIFWLVGVNFNITTDTTAFFGNMIAGYTNINGSIVVEGTVPANVNGRVYTLGASITFSDAGSATAVLLPPEPSVVCYVKGTKILTPDGFVAVEDIAVGDKISTYGDIVLNKNVMYSSENRVVRMISFSVRSGSSSSTPIRIQKGALGENAPFEDLYVSPNHRMVIDSKLVSAYRLVDGDTITQEYDSNTVTYYHIELASHCAIVANGVLSESFDTCTFKHVCHRRAPAANVCMSKIITASTRIGSSYGGTT